MNNNIDYDKLIKDQETSRKIYNKAAQIKRLSSGDIKTAEYISGKKLLPAIDPIQEFLENQKAQKMVEPIVKAVENIPLPIQHDPYFEAIEAEPYLDATPIRSEAIETPKEAPEVKTLTLFSPEEVKLLHDGGLNIKFLTTKKENFLKNAENVITKINKKNIELGALKSKDTKGTQKMTEDERERLNKYKLVADRFRSAIKHRMVSLGVKPSTSTGLGLFPLGQRLGRGMTSDLKNCSITKQIWERIKVLLGEMRAGNTSTELRKELIRLYTFLFKQNQITKDQLKLLSKKTYKI